MAQLGRLEHVVLDTSGNAVNGASVEVRKQGATVNGAHAGAHTSFTVNDPGGVTSSSENVVVNTGTTTRSVSSVAATNVTVGAPGFTDVADDDRLSPTTNLPTLYNDAQAGETKANPLTTDSTGKVTCWLPGGYYDLLLSGSSITTTLVQDVYVVGEEVRSNVFDASTAAAFVRDTTRTLSTSGAVIERWQNADDTKFQIGYDGSVTSTGSGYFHDNLTASGTIVALGGVSFPSGSITTTMLASDAATSLFSADGAAATAAVAATLTSRASVSVSVSATCDLLIVADGNYDITTNAAGEDASIQIFWGGTGYSKGSIGGNSASAPGIVNVATHKYLTSIVSGTYTAALQDIRGASMVVTYRGDIDPAHITVVQFRR